MLKKYILCVLICFSGFACAEKPPQENHASNITKNSASKVSESLSDSQGDSIELSNCNISLASIHTFRNIKDAKLSEIEQSIDPDSGEQVVTQTVSYNNGDTVLVRQSFCYLYNFEAEYFLTNVSEENFKLAINRIDNLVANVDQDYKLKAALVDVVELMMNLNNFATGDSFEHGLPAQAVISSQYVEHGLSFKAANETDIPAVIDFYFSLDGEE